MLQDAQFGHLYPFTDYHKHLLFLRPAAFNRNRFNNNRIDWLIDYNTKIPIIPSRYDPDTISHSPVTKLDSPLKYCGNDDGGVRE